MTCGPRALASGTRRGLRRLAARWFWPRLRGIDEGRIRRITDRHTLMACLLAGTLVMAACSSSDDSESRHGGSAVPAADLSPVPETETVDSNELSPDTVAHADAESETHEADSPRALDDETAVSGTATDTDLSGQALDSEQDRTDQSSGNDAESGAVDQGSDSDHDVADEETPDEDTADNQPTPPLWTLWGTVDHGWADPVASGRDVAMAADIGGAVVEIVDGPDAGRQTLTDERGRWALQGLKEGRITVRVTAEGFAPAERTLDLTADTELPFAMSRRLSPPDAPVEFPDTDPGFIRAVAAHYPYVHRVGNVRVSSDISAEFSREHAEHAWMVWAFFDDLFAGNRGDYLDVYYTTDIDTFLKLRPHCRADLWLQYSLTNDTRVLTACYLDYPRWFIIPYQIPDLGTQLHEFGHDFLFAVWPAWDDYKWFIEGTAMYFEGGEFSNSLRIRRPHSYCTTLFDRWDQQNRLIPLGELLRLNGEDYLADNHRTYPLSCMLFHYIERHHPGVLYSMIEQINSRQITTNDRLIDVMLELTRMSVSELEAAYVDHARRASA